MMDFQIGTVFVRIAAGMRNEHMHITIVAPIGNKQMICTKLNLSSEQDTQALTGEIRTYQQGDHREEAWALDNE